MNWQPFQLESSIRCNILPVGFVVLKHPLVFYLFHFCPWLPWFTHCFRITHDQLLLQIVDELWKTSYRNMLLLHKSLWVDDVDIVIGCCLLIRCSEQSGTWQKQRQTNCLLTSLVHKNFEAAACILNIVELCTGMFVVQKLLHSPWHWWYSLSRHSGHSAMEVNGTLPLNEWAQSHGASEASLPKIGSVGWDFLGSWLQAAACAFCNSILVVDLKA